MRINRTQSGFAVAILVLAGWGAGIVRGNANPTNILTGSAAFASYKTEKPGDWHRITVADLPKPFATDSSDNGAKVVPRPATKPKISERCNSGMRRLRMSRGTSSWQPHNMMQIRKRTTSATLLNRSISGTV